jgi:hypothetical protein
VRFQLAVLHEQHPSFIGEKILGVSFRKIICPLAAKEDTTMNFFLFSTSKTFTYLEFFSSYTLAPPCKNLINFNLVNIHNKVWKNVVDLDQVSTFLYHLFSLFLIVMWKLLYCCYKCLVFSI